MGTGTEPYNFSKPIYLWVLAILLNFAAGTNAEAYVNTQLKNFSRPEPAISKPRYHEPLPDPGDAILWQVPPYKVLATRLSRNEEEARYKQALNILVNAAFENDAQLNAARNKLKRSQLTKLSIDLIQQLSSYDLKSNNNSEAENYIRATLNEINKQFKIYSASYFQSSRDAKWLEQIETAAAYLSYSCSQAAVEEVTKLYLGGQDAGTNKTITTN
jgi:hypothetical protein